MLNKKNVIFVLFIITMISILFGLNKMNTKTHESESLSNEFIKQRYDYYAEQDRLNSSDWIKYGNLYEGEEDYKEAMKCYENAIEKDATNALAYYSKGNMLYVFQDYEAAFENFRISSEIENANVEKSAALVSMADCYIFIDLNESINYLRQAKELDKESQYDYDGEIQFLNKLNNLNNEEELSKCVLEFVESEFMNWSIIRQKNLLEYYKKRAKDPEIYEKYNEKLRECEEYWNE